jgi:hypothetical protein
MKFLPNPQSNFHGGISDPVTSNHSPVSNFAESPDAQSQFLPFRCTILTLSGQTREINSEIFPVATSSAAMIPA